MHSYHVITTISHDGIPYDDAFGLIAENVSYVVQHWCVCLRKTNAGGAATVIMR